ncbi:MAG: hypothetical protein ABR540_03890 [Acidimicrobiales bacterium]
MAKTWRREWNVHAVAPRGCGATRPRRLRARRCCAGSWSAGASIPGARGTAGPLRRPRPGRRATRAARSAPAGVRAGYIVVRFLRFLGGARARVWRVSITWRSTVMRRRAGSTRSAVRAAISPQRRPE